MMKVAIVEDRQEDLASLTKHLNDYAAARNINIDITAYVDALSFLADYAMQYDCVFMDIVAPNSNGMEKTKELRAIDPELPVIFCTCLEQYAVQGYMVNAFDYIIKPVKSEKLFQVMDNLRGKIERKRNKEIFVKCTESIVRIPLSLLYYVSVEGHKVVYHTSFGDFESRKSMKEVEKLLEGLDFTRINSGCMVNIQYVNQVSGNEIRVGEEVLFISRAKKKKVLDDINEFLSRNN